MTIVNLQIEIFLLIVIGFFLTKKGIIKAPVRKALTDLVIYVILPANIIQSFDIDMDVETLKTTGFVLLAGFIIQGFYAVLNLFLYRGFPPAKQVNLKYGTICSNAGFMGLPLSSAVFGPMGLLYASVALLPIRLFMWSEGLSLYTSTTKKQVAKTLLTHPCIIAVFIGFALMLMPWNLPDAISNTIGALSDCCTAMSMLVIGSIISDVDFRTLFEKGALYYSALRLVLIPLAIYAVLSLTGMDRLGMSILVFLAAMPAGSTTAMLALKYDQDPEFASKLVCTSTLFSLVTLSIWAAYLT